MWLFLACATPELPAQYDQCTDATCRSGWVVQHWKTQPDVVTEIVAKEPDEMVRIVLVRQLTDAYPGELMGLCGKLPAGPATDQCRTMNSRPHLRKAATAATATATATARTYADVPADVVTCATEAKVCQMETARSRIEAGDDRGAAAACNALEAGSVRSECFFQAAEAAMANGRSIDAAVVTKLCLGGEKFNDNCLIHLTRSVGRLAPRSTEKRPEAWAAATAAINAAQTELTAIDPTRAARYSDKAWAQVLRAAYSFDAEVTGIPFERLPAEIAPQVRAAAATRFRALHLQETWTIPEWKTRFAAALADRAPRLPMDRGQVAEPKVVDRWRTKLAGEEAIPTVPWSYRTDRPFSEDPDTDGLICLVMSAGTEDPADVAFLGAAVKDEDRLVRFTAAMLLSEISPDGVFLAGVRHDSDPLIRARAKQASRPDLPPPGR